MEDIALAASGLGKQFHIGARAASTVSHHLATFVRGRPGTRPIWAVRGVDLTLRRGECVGLIGANGAGKTTLLTMLAGLMLPSTGSIVVRGRASPFFQIASGLYSDLTVLDNIRLAGALFGMRADQLESRLEAIVAFGELEEYLFARLGALSVGYQSRVPFATALHSDIDVLLTDEVFAVGDASFCRKCLVKMEELMGAGKTVVMASHNMDLIVQNCDRVLWLEHGTIREQGEPEGVVSRYLANCR